MRLDEIAALRHQNEVCCLVVDSLCSMLEIEQPYPAGLVPGARIAEIRARLGQAQEQAAKLAARLEGVKI